jgi:tetratricopeptide (TPR) repeat protein
MNPGFTFANRFTIRNPAQDLLGRGGMGDVYRATDAQTGGFVAAKILNPEALARDPGLLERFAREGEALRQLNHPNIVRMVAAAEENGQHYLVMEFVGGGSLQDLLTAQGRLSSSQVVKIALEVADALTRAHHLGILHRDLKPANVLLAQDGTPRLTDFGIASLPDSPHLTQTGVLVGTVAYLSPEVCQGRPPDERSDIWAFGVMLFELLTGQQPFKGANLTATLTAILTQPTPDLAQLNLDVPAALADLLYRMLEKDPQQRIPSVRLVGAELEALSKGWQVATPLAGREKKIEPVEQSAQHRLATLTGPGRLVGREPELAEALQLWRMAQQGDSGLLLISGEPGIGKSRLVRELTMQVQMAHGVPLVGECYAEGGAPYAAFAQAILGVADWPAALPPLVLADLISLVPGLRVRYPEVPPNPSLDPQAEQQRVYESAFAFFSRLASRAPVLLVLEDVHWADGGTLALLRSLARRFRQAHAPVLIGLTFREAELAEQKGLTDLLNNWNHERLATTIKLHRLDQSTTQTMLEALFVEAVTAEFAQRIYRETEGNPFFIEEICKALIEEGQVYHENGRWQRRSLSAFEMPRSIRMAIETRLTGLPEATQEVLHLAAVLGRRFEFAVLQAAYAEGADSGADEETLIAALEGAERAQLLNEIGRGGGALEFAHALIPTSITEGLSGMRRRRLHRRALAALEKLHPDDYKTLAHHCLEASEDERAMDYLVKAAERARAAFANAEAVANYQQALRLLDELLREQTRADHWRAVALQLHEALGDTLELTGLHEEAWAAYQSALTLISSNDPIRRSRLYRKAGKTRETLRLYDEATQAYQQAEMALGAEPAEGATEWRQEWVMIQLDRSYLEYWRGRVPEMTLLAEKVRPAIERYGTPSQRSKFFSDLALMTYRRDRYVISDETLAYNSQALSAAQQSGSPGELAWAQFLSGFSRLWHGDLNEAEETLQASLQLCERTGDVTTQSRCLTYLTVTYRKRGDIEKVRRFAARSQEAAAIGQMIEYVSMAEANLAWAARREGKLAEARELGEAAWMTMQKTVQAQMFVWVAVWPLIGICLAQNRLAEAVEYARKLFSPTTQPQPKAVAACLQAAVHAWEQGKPEKASTSLTQAANLAEPLGYL